MEHFKRGNQYLVLKEKIDKTKGIYYCRICGVEKIIPFWNVVNSHDKTCGCMNGKNLLEFDITKEGFAITKTGMEISCKMAKGYRGVKGKYLHRLVAEKYLPNPNELTDINHKDGNKQNNHVNNLEWCSRSYNITHAWLNNLNQGVTGQKNAQRKFTDEQIIEIRNSSLGCTTLAKQLGVSKPTILNIRHNRIYKTIGDNDA